MTPTHNINVFIYRFNDSSTTEIYTLSLHDALPICSMTSSYCRSTSSNRIRMCWSDIAGASSTSWSMSTRTRIARSIASCRCWRSEEHTSELQSHVNLVCRLLLEKKKNLG